MWVVTREVNAYDQYGEYFVGCFNSKPNEAALREMVTGLSVAAAQHLLAGGGRQHIEEEWWNLSMYNEGEAFE
tara:strand:+ start:2295 stop:2513 length:219 start_codon:yes stop_codon:yes gene_type:complete